jgi:hypothetical protein
MKKPPDPERARIIIAIRHILAGRKPRSHRPTPEDLQPPRLRLDRLEERTNG